MSTNWIKATLFLFLSYVYLFVRTITTYDDVNHELFIALIETSLFFGLASYLNSKMLHRELSANFKAERSSKEFKQFLSCLPEGVSIVDNDNNEFKFCNSKLKQSFDLKLYCESGTKTERFLALANQMDKDFEKSFNRTRSKNVENFPDPLQGLMAKFRTIKGSKTGEELSSSNLLAEFEGITYKINYRSQKE